ncbi:MAG TPA: hypothetical protein VMM12_00885 [Longimicrobiales bacterium]|nr:hypothetical protein [Longimicrobiales bacterium]
MFFRRDARDDAWLPAKVALFTVGALLAVAGMALGNDWVIGGAALVLAAGIGVRFLPREEAPEEEEEEEEEEERRRG